MLHFQNLSKTYGSSGTKAVDQLDLAVKDGEIFGVLGPNGAGKTTTIKMLCGILKADQGTIAVDGIDVVENPLEAKQGFGLVPDNPEIFNNLKAWEYLNFVAQVYNVAKDDRVLRVEPLAQRFKIADALNNRISSFSHGMKQKLMVIASLIHDPKNWILDEPMVGLDPQAAFDMKELMGERKAAGKSVFFSTHVLEVAERVCDRVGIIAKGTLRFVGTVDELRATRGGDGDLEQLFLSLVEEEGESHG